MENKIFFLNKKWDGFRDQYQGIIKNLINNIDICDERFVKEGEDGHMVAKKKYIKELEELKTFIKKKEVELGYYSLNDEVIIKQNDNNE